MAIAKTRPFFITKRLTFAPNAPAGTLVGNTISIESFVDIASSQGLEILEVDWIIQGHDPTGDVYYAPTTGLNMDDPGSLSYQLLDQATVGIVGADHRTLISSGQIDWGLVTDNIWSGEQKDFYPDIFNKNTDGRVTINDTLHLMARLSDSGLKASEAIIIVCKIKCRVVTLTKSDFISVSLTNVSSDQ